MSLAVGGVRISPQIGATVLVLCVSVLGQTVAASEGSGELAIFATAAFAGAMLRLGWQVNAPWWHSVETGLDIGPSRLAAEPTLAARNLSLIALCYAWGAASLLDVYLISPVRWQHGWQYGTGMAAIAVMLFWGSRRLQDTWSLTHQRALIWASLIQGWAATGGMAWMIGTWKIYSPKGDWPANIVFMGGGLTVVGLTILALRSTRFLGGKTAT